MSGYESPQPDDETTTDGAMGAGGADAPDLAAGDGGDATGGGSMGDQDAMGSDQGRTVEEGAGGPVSGFGPEASDDEADGGLDVPPGTPVP